jgi:hypothetical protein
VDRRAAAQNQRRKKGETMNEELRGLLARRAVDHALKLTGPLPADATPVQRRAMSELVDAADELAADALAAWRVKSGGAPDHDARQILALLVVQAVAVLSIGRAFRLATGGDDGGEGAGDAPIQ